MGRFFFTNIYGLKRWQCLFKYITSKTTLNQFFFYNLFCFVFLELSD